VKVKSRRHCWLLHWTDKAEVLQCLRSGSYQRLIIPHARLHMIGDCSFRVTAARAWNSLPASVTSARSLTVFKRQMKKFLFDNSFS